MENQKFTTTIDMCDLHLGPPVKKYAPQINNINKVMKIR